MRYLIILLLAAAAFGQEVKSPTLKEPPLCAGFESNLEFFDAVRFLPVTFRDYKTETVYGIYDEVKKMRRFQRELPLALHPKSRVPDNFRSGAWKKGRWVMFYVRCEYNGVEQNVLLMAEPIPN